MTAAPGTGFPRGSSTRPTTNIRPGAGVGLASSAFAATGNGGPAEEPCGSSFVAEWPAPMATETTTSERSLSVRGDPWSAVSAPLISSHPTAGTCSHP